MFLSQKIKYIYGCLWCLLVAVPIHAQYEEDEIVEDSDTIATDSLWADSLIIRHDTLPWPQNVQAEIDRLLEHDMFQTSQLGLMIWDLDADSAIYQIGRASCRERV